MDYPRVDFSYKTSREAIKRGVSQGKLYNVFLLFPNHKMPSKYVAGLVKIKKNTKTYIFDSITLTPSLKDNYSMVQAYEVYLKMKEAEGNLKERDGSLFKIDLILTENPERMKNRSPIFVSPFRLNKEMEDEMIRIYTNWFYKITKGKSFLPIQELSLNNGLILDEEKSGVRLKIDYDTIRPHTFALMFAMYYVKKDVTMEIIKSIQN